VLRRKLVTAGWILRRDKQSMSSRPTLVRKLTFEDGAEYREMWIDEFDFKNEIWNTK